MNIEIISIGDELLIGQVVNTNASWLAAKCKEWGLRTTKIITVADKPEAIKHAISEALNHIDLAIMTGGLGPTKDDITKSVLCEIFQTELKLNEDVLNHIKTIFSRRNLHLSELNVKQAEVPIGAKILRNELGTAPGLIFQKDNFTLICLPGVPFEMKNIVENPLKTFILDKFKLPPVVSENVMVCGIPESFLAEKLEDWENNLKNKKLSLAYLPQPGIIRLRITADTELKNGQELITKSIDELKKIIPENIFAIGDTTMEKIVGELLKSQEKTLSTAESCTGGYIAHLITTVPGSSAYFKGSVVAYDNSIKKEVLKVNEDDLLTHGAVSETVVFQMAKNTREIFNTDYTIAVSGIAGPDGGTEEKPVGTVWIAVASESNVVTRKFQLTNDRIRNIIRASVIALDMLRNQLNL